MFKFVNLTPHLIFETEMLVAFQPSGKIARVTTTREQTGDIGGIPLFSIVFGEVVGLPEPQDGIIYIVSGMVKQAVPFRDDVVSPGELVRDEAGQPVGCLGFNV